MNRSLVVSALLLQSVTAWSDDRTETRVGISDVIVTARRYAEPAQEVPLAITTVTRTDIERVGIRDMDDLAAVVPGLAYSFARGTGGTPVLRGMNATQISVDQNNVATLLDGLYIANAYAVDVTMLDLERVDVLRGPQNALIGRNAFAGAILYTPAQPTNTFESEMRAGLGKDRIIEESAFVSGPLTDGLHGRLAGKHESYDGSVRNLGDPNHNLGGWSKHAWSGTLVWRRSERFQAELAGYRLEHQRDATARSALGDVAPFFNCGLNPSSGAFVNFCGAVPSRSAVDISADARGFDSVTSLAKLLLGWSIGSITVTSITGLIDTRMDTPPDDWDMTSAGVLLPVANVHAPNVVTRLQRANEYFSGFPTDDHEWSEELRVAAESGPLRWTLGTSFSDNRSFSHAGSSTDARGLGPDETFAGGGFVDQTRTPLELFPAFQGTGTDRIWAVFGTANLRLTSAVELTGELRWSRERWHGETQLAFGQPVQAPPQIGEWSFVTPRFTVQYHWSDDGQTYASAAQGARSGGFNDPVSPNAPEEVRFNAERNWTYELGTKARVAGGRLQANTALYLVDWSDMQIAGGSRDPSFPYPVTRNLGAVRVQGIEASVDARASAWLDLSLSYAYTDARFRPGTVDLGNISTCGPDICHLIPGPPSIPLVPDIGGNRLPGESRNALAASSTFHGTLGGNRRWYVRLDLDASDRQFVSTDNVNWLPARHLLNAGLGVTSGRLRLALWGRNLTNERYSGFVTFGSTDFGGQQIVVDRANGRRWGASMSYHFGASDSNND